MKKYLFVILSVLFTIFFIPNTKALENVEITNVTISEKTENVIASVENYKGLILNTKETFNNAGDYVKYKVTIKNNSNSELPVSNIMDNSQDEYIETIYEYEKAQIKPNEEYSFYITIKYKKEIIDNNKKLNLPLEITIDYTNGEKTTILANPKTHDNIILYVAIFSISLFLLEVFKKNKKKILPVILALLIIPTVVNALDNQLIVNLNNDIEINNENAPSNDEEIITPVSPRIMITRQEVKVTSMKNGREINRIFKTLAGNDLQDQEAKDVKDENIKAIKKAQSLPENIELTEDNIISLDDSKEPVYAWFEDGTIYYYTESDKIYLNEDCWSLFSEMNNLETIDLEIFDTSKVTTMRSMFYNCNNLKKIDLSNFDTSNVTSMRTMFYSCTSLKTIDLSNFNTSNVTEMLGLFYNCENLENLNVSSFDTSNATDMSWMFGYCASLKDLNLDSFNTGNVTNMSYMFYKTNFKNIDFVKKFDTSNVTTLKGTFGYMFELEDITALKEWKTGNVTDMSTLLIDSRSLNDLTGLEKWDTSKVTTFSFAFGLNPEPQGGRKKDNAIIDMTPLKDWNTSSATTMYCMFQNYNIKSFEPFRKWNVSKVEDFSNMFNQTKWTTVTTLSGLEEWDVSSAKVMNDMFFDGHKLEDVSAIENWDVTNVENFNSMFSGSKVYPQFTKVNGTWKNGTFTKQ